MHTCLTHHLNSRHAEQLNSVTVARRVGGRWRRRFRRIFLKPSTAMQGFQSSPCAPGGFVSDPSPARRRRGVETVLTTRHHPPCPGESSPGVRIRPGKEGGQNERERERLAPPRPEGARGERRILVPLPPSPSQALRRYMCAHEDSLVTAQSQARNRCDRLSRDGQMGVKRGSKSSNEGQKEGRRPSLSNHTQPPATTPLPPTSQRGAGRTMVRELPELQLGSAARFCPSC